MMTLRGSSTTKSSCPIWTTTGPKGRTPPPRHAHQVHVHVCVKGCVMQCMQCICVHEEHLGHWCSPGEERGPRSVMLAVGRAHALYTRA